MLWLPPKLVSIIPLFVAASQVKSLQFLGVFDKIQGYFGTTGQLPAKPARETAGKRFGLWQGSYSPANLVVARHIEPRGAERGVSTPRIAALAQIRWWDARNTQENLGSAVCVKQGGSQGGEGLMVAAGFPLLGIVEGSKE